MNRAYLLFGSNLGDAANNIQHAQHLLAVKGISILRSSSLYKTQPWGYASEHWFLNQVSEINTTLSCVLLSQLMHETETMAGRTPHHTHGYEDRIIDIDLLLFNDETRDATELTIPHPRMHLRRFTLLPLQELIPSYVHPILNKKISQLLADCNDNSDVIKI